MGNNHSNQWQLIKDELYDIIVWKWVTTIKNSYIIQSLKYEW